MRTKRLFIFAGFVAILAVTAVITPAQKHREHLTAKEIELVRDAQELDLRTMVFVRIIERRIQVLTGVDPSPPESAKKAAKQAELFGDLPTGTPAQLYYDIEHVLDEAINNIDDTAGREPDNKLMHKGVRILAGACKRLMPQLISFKEKATERNELEPLSNAIEYAQSVLDTLGKVPTEVEEKKAEKAEKEKKKKSKDQ